MSAQDAPLPEGLEVYVGLADELSANPRFIEDEADPQFVKTAQDAAHDHGLPWPPTPDVDLALEQVRAALGAREAGL